MANNNSSVLFKFSLDLEKVMLNFKWYLYPTVCMMVKVTEEVRKNIEVRLKESAEFQTQLEKKLMEVEKEKQELQDDKRKAIESMEQQVNEVITI